MTDGTSGAAVASTPKRYSFIVEYFDPHASLTRTYQLVYFLEDNTIAMDDLKTRRMFLKRCAYPSLQLKELFVGATVNVFARPLKVVDYGDNETRRCFSANAGEFLLAVAQNGLANAGRIVEMITAKELRIANIRLVDLDDTELVARNGLSTRCLLILVNGAGAEAKVKEVCSAFAGVVAVVADASDVRTLTASAFGPSRSTAVTHHCAVCVIKPHAITSGHQGPILQRLIDEGFEITALGAYTMSVADAEDFLEVYSGVLPEYKKMVEQVASGPCWAIEVCAENAVAALRAVCGPHDPEICHVLFPHTIRAKYGVDRIRNAVHCTDLEEDGTLESEFFFSLTQNKRE